MSTLPLDDSLAIEIRGLEFAYNGETVLDDVHLAVRAGEFVVVLGPNGGGKTTLVKCLLGLLTPRRGTVRVLGQTPPLGPGLVGYVPQQAGTRKGFPITVEQVVQLGLGRDAAAGSARRNQVLEALARVEMVHLAKCRFDALSGGQQQRALVARALAPRPRLLIFDEPTANIDPRGKLCLFEMLGQLARDTTVLVVSHDLVAASVGVTRVAAVNRRLLSAVAGPQGVLTPEILSLLYGVHDPRCPVDGYLASVAGLFGGGTALPAFPDKDLT